MAAVHWLVAFLALASVCHYVVADDDESLGTAPGGRTTFPPPTPAETPEVREDENSVSGRRIIIGGDSGWTIKPYEDVPDALVGDILVFNWVGSQTVTLLEERECKFGSGLSTELAATDNSLGFNPPDFQSFEYELVEPGEYHFASSVPGNCKNGMIFTVTVAIS